MDDKFKYIDEDVTKIICHHLLEYKSDVQSYEEAVVSILRVVDRFVKQHAG